MIYCKALNQEFRDKYEMFHTLNRVKKELFLSKKSQTKIADSVGGYLGCKKEATKEGENETPQINFGSYVFPVINTTLLMDSHEDLHLNGIWDKSAKEQKGKVSLIINHEFKVGNVVSYPDEVEPMVKTLTWKELGQSYEGETQALIFKSLLTEDSNPIAFGIYKRNKSVQHSIRMQYIDMKFCVNSQDKEWKEEYLNWEKYFPLMVNPEKADEIGYFWAVKEAKIYKEGSMVIEGSNHVTPTLYSEAGKTTSIKGPDNSTRIDYLNKLIQLTKN